MIDLIWYLSHYCIVCYCSDALCVLIIFLHQLCVKHIQLDFMYFHRITENICTCTIVHIHNKRQNSLILAVYLALLFFAFQFRFSINSMALFPQLILIGLLCLPILFTLAKSIISVANCFFCFCVLFEYDSRNGTVCDYMPNVFTHSHTHDENIKTTKSETCTIDFFL